MQRWDIINHYARKINAKTFLEIGYFVGWSFDNVSCEKKTAVDPNPCKNEHQREIPYGTPISNEHGIIWKMTSDEFFNTTVGKQTFDVIFIDGLHESTQVFKDIENSLKVLSEGGVIIVHDCNPPKEEHTTLGVEGCWTGDVYKAILKARSLLNINFFCIDTDWGVGVITKSDKPSAKGIPWQTISWQDFDRNRSGLLSLITVDEFNAREIVPVSYAHLQQEIEKKKVPENLVLISAQPHDPYFQWQLEVQITNFREHGVSDKMHVLVWYPREGRTTGWNLLEQKYPEVKFFYYQDQGVDLNLYIPQLRPHILKMHFNANPVLQQSLIFYHDSDIIFNYLPDFELLSQGTTAYTSDTSSYLDYSYLRVKEVQGGIEEDLVSKGLAELTGVDIADIKKYDKNSGGAQYVLKNIDTKFWEDVEADCLKIRKFLMTDINTRYFNSENDGYQSWCADMWAVNFCLWKRGINTQTTPLLDFSWATDTTETYYKKPIYHNAGATHQSQGIFYKGAWINQSPIGQNLGHVSQSFASSKYVEAIHKVK